VSEGEVSLAIEYKVTAHLGKVELLWSPDPSPDDQPDVAPDGARGCDCSQTPTLGSEALIAGAFWIGEPEKRMAQAIGEGFEMYGAGERDHRDPPLARRNLLIELPQLREMLLAVESTEVAQQHQNGWAPKQPARWEVFAVERHEVEVEIDPHRKHDASLPAAICDPRHARARALGRYRSGEPSSPVIEAPR